MGVPEVGARDPGPVVPGSEEDGADHYVGGDDDERQRDWHVDVVVGRILLLGRYVERVALVRLAPRALRSASVHVADALGALLARPELVLLRATLVAAVAAATACDQP